MSPEMIQAKVNARNSVNAALLQRASAMRDALIPFVGQKILKTTGELLKKVADALPKTQSTADLLIYYTTGSGYSLRACFRACNFTSGFNAYAEADAYLCDIENGVLKAIYPNETLQTHRTNYTADEVNYLQNEIKATKATLSKLESRLTQIIL